MENFKITFVLPSYSWRPSGGFKVVYEYANRLSDHGFKISIVHPRKLNNFQDKTNLFHNFKKRLRSSFESVFYPSLNWHNIDSRVKILYVPSLEDRYIPKADIIFATAWQTAEYVKNYSSEKGIKYYLIQSYEIWSGPKNRIEKTWQSPLNKIVISKWLFEKGLEIGIKADDLKYIPNGIDGQDFKIINKIQERRDSIAMLYSPLKIKGAVYRIKALEIVHRNNPHINAILFGLKKREKQIPSWINYVRNPSKEKLVKDIYNKSCIYLCPSLLEGWHLPPAEAMACGCALVSTDIGGVKDYSINEETALLSPPNNAQDLAANTLRLLENPALRYKIAENGNKLIKQFTWDKSVDMLEKHIVEAL